MGFADSPHIQSALERIGLVLAGWEWEWFPGTGGGTYPPHFDLNGKKQPDEFDPLPGDDLNGDSCGCLVAPIYEDAVGDVASTDSDSWARKGTKSARALAR